PFEAAGGGSIVAQQATEIVTRDLDYTDRFSIVSTPAGLTTGAITYGPWNDLGVSYLVSGSVSQRGDNWALTVVVHDVTYGNVMSETTYAIPAPADPRFRLAVHAISDAVVERITGQPGMAASVIAFVRRSPNGYELMMV